MSLAVWVTIAASAVAAATPLIFAALGELVTERAGVLNLGVEGMMLVGAMSGFAVGVSSGSLLLAYLAAAASGVLIALLFGVLTLSLQTNQLATGLALTIFGVGLSAFAGRSYREYDSRGAYWPKTRQERSAGWKSCWVRCPGPSSPALCW